MKKQDLTGYTFKTYKVTCEAPKSAGMARWNYICLVCGSTKTGYAKHIKKQLVRDCKCQTRIHHPLYNMWQGMVHRCLTPSSTGYHMYGGRGIKVCERWREFFNFIEDMGPRPDGGTIERIDNNGNYEPGNCRWATNEEQQHNKRSNVFITYKGKTQTVMQWSKETGIPFARIRKRLNSGFGLEDVFQPSRFERSRPEFFKMGRMKEGTYYRNKKNETVYLHRITKDNVIILNTKTNRIGSPSKKGFVRGYIETNNPGTTPIPIELDHELSKFYAKKEIKKAEYVFYKDGNAQNKTLENVVICKTKNELLELKMDQKSMNAGGDVGWLKCPYCKQFDDPSKLYIKVVNGRPRSHWHRECRNKHLFKKRHGGNNNG